MNLAVMMTLFHKLAYKKYKKSINQIIKSIVKRNLNKLSNQIMNSNNLNK
jgi:hypothetical protein